jgi:two-component system NtrC family sensor kinase
MKDKKAQRLLAVLEALEGGIYIISQDYTVEFMNQAMVRDFGPGIGKKCYEMINRSDEKCPWCRAEEVFEKEETLRYERYIPASDKSYDLIDIPIKNMDGSTSKLAIYRDITERRRREKILWTTQADYRRLFENVGCGVYISSKEGKFLDANQALLNMIGYEYKEEFLEIDITKDLYLRPDDRRQFQKMIERDGRVIDYEVDFKRKDGSTIPVQLTSTVRYDHLGNVLGYEGIIVDQSQRKQMEKERNEAHDFLNMIIRSSPNAIIATDMDGRIILWNRAAEETLGYRAQDVIYKMNIQEIYPDGMTEKVMKLMRGPEYGGGGRLTAYPMVYIRQAGGIVEGNLSASIIYDAEGNEVASVGIFTDLKERLEMERKLRQTQEQLLNAEKLAAMGRLTSQIAHELNNPLYGIMNTLELLKTEISPQSKRRKILEMALSETVRLTDLLRKMLSFSKPDQEKRQIADINVILDEILILHEKQLRENDIKIVYNLGEGLGKVHASINQLRQVFLNMISNARDAMPDGGTLTVNTRRQNKTIRIDVNDTGVGIHPKNVNRIFDAFFTTKDSVKGVGLGLSVCYGFIKDHGGDITVESQPDKGTTFTITLPTYTEQI